MNAERISDIVVKASSLFRDDFGRMKQRALIGGAFGTGRFVICSLPYERGGLHAVYYFVAEMRTGTVIGYGADQPFALARAREMLALPGELMERIYGAVAEDIVAERRRASQAADALVAARRAERKQQAQAKESSVPRRRQQIFDKSEGKCHYCAAPLTLDGRWHIEHMMPRALMGTDAPTNLVASCVSCNMKKRDRTAEEFIAKQNGGAA